MSPHPLVAILDDSANGRFPPADGTTDILPPDPHGTLAVVALTGHAYVLADVDPDSLEQRLPTGWHGGYGGALHPGVLCWLADEGREIGTVDVVLVAPGTGGGSSAVSVAAADDHPRVRRAQHHRRDVEVFGNDDGMVILGRGLVGRRELAVELYEPGSPAAGAGRRLIDDGLRHVPAGECCWAQVAPGNARSLRAFLACGFTPIGSEVLLV